MIEAIAYPHEEKRMEAVRSLHVLDAPIEERFERVTRMVRRVLNVPIALFNIIDTDRQHYKSAQGVTATNVPLDGAFCTHALHEREMLLIPNAQKDERFHDNPFVTGERMSIRFYAGCPIRTADGMPIGTLCAIDTKPRKMTHEQLSTLKDLAQMIETELQVSMLKNNKRHLEDELLAANLLAKVDPLTRLWNRSGIQVLVDKQWAECTRQSRPFTVVMTDIDKFKLINDNHGHAMGDAVLRATAKRLLEALRTEDSVGRVGGEEFLLVLADCRTDQAFDTVERIRQKIANFPLETEEGPFPITMSFGVCSLIPDEHMKAEDLIKSADKALYAAKNNGRNRVELA